MQILITTTQQLLKDLSRSERGKFIHAMVNTNAVCFEGRVYKEGRKLSVEGQALRTGIKRTTILNFISNL